MSRIKVLTSAVKTREEMERLVRETVGLQIAREKFIADRDNAVAEVTGKFQCGIDATTEEIERSLALIEQWSEAHRAEFGRDKSLAVEGHRIGWRLGQPTPKPVKKLTWKGVVDRIFEFFDEEQQDTFLRVKYEPNKEAMLAVRESQPALLTKIGVEIVQAETFYLDPAREGQPDKRLVSEAKEAA